MCNIRFRSRLDARLLQAQPLQHAADRPQQRDQRVGSDASQARPSALPLKADQQANTEGETEGFDQRVIHEFL